MVCGCRKAKKNVERAKEGNVHAHAPASERAAPDRCSRGDGGGHNSRGCHLGALIGVHTKTRGQCRFFFFKKKVLLTFGSFHPQPPPQQLLKVSADCNTCCSAFFFFKCLFDKQEASPGRKGLCGGSPTQDYINQGIISPGLCSTN